MERKRKTPDCDIEADEDPATTVAGEDANTRFNVHLQISRDLAPVFEDTELDKPYTEPIPAEIVAAMPAKLRKVPTVNSIFLAFLKKEDETDAKIRKLSDDSVAWLLCFLKKHPTHHLVLKAPSIFSRNAHLAAEYLDLEMHMIGVSKLVLPFLFLGIFLLHDFQALPFLSSEKVSTKSKKLICRSVGADVESHRTFIPEYVAAVAPLLVFEPADPDEESLGSTVVESLQSICFEEEFEPIVRALVLSKVSSTDWKEIVAGSLCLGFQPFVATSDSSICCRSFRRMG